LDTTQTRLLTVALLLFACAVLVLGALALLQTEADRYYIYEPGTVPLISASTQCTNRGGGSPSLTDGRPCARIFLPGGRGSGTLGSVMMVDVNIGKPDLLQYLGWKLHLLPTGTELLPDAQVPTASLTSCVANQDMLTSEQIAEALALRELGYAVGEKDAGAVLVEVVGGTAAASAGLACNDVVTAVNDTPIATSAQLQAAIQSYKPGTVVTLAVDRPSGSGDVKSLHLRVRLGRTRSSHNKVVAFLGVFSETDASFVLPFPIRVDVGDIGGPSAGLALTLGIIDALGGGDLTGGHAVAATGEIEPDGSVFDVGGVAQKTVAVRRAGAQIFLVPTQEVAVARKSAGSMKVMGVSDLSQAVSDLEALGGRLPARSGTQ
jgi:PDZ domain-containing protein